MPLEDLVKRLQNSAALHDTYCRAVQYGICNIIEHFFEKKRKSLLLNLTTTYAVYAK